MKMEQTEFYTHLPAYENGTDRIPHAPTCLWRSNRQNVPKRRHIKFRRRKITQNKAYNNSNFSYYFFLYFSLGSTHSFPETNFGCKANFSLFLPRLHTLVSREKFWLQSKFFFISHSAPHTHFQRQILVAKQIFLYFSLGSTHHFQRQILVAKQIFLYFSLGSTHSFPETNFGCKANFSLFLTRLHTLVSTDKFWLISKFFSNFLYIFHAQHIFILNI